jgi:tetratricopeptide (TPR) repeat protein
MVDKYYVLSRKLEVTRRTILRDIDYLRLMYQPPIEYNFIKREFYYAELNFFIKSVILTEGSCFPSSGCIRAKKAIFKEEITMWEYKETSMFDIGEGYGEYTYDFFVVNGEDDFQKLMKYYENLVNRFSYYVDHTSKMEDNKGLSPYVKAAMKKHNANCCLTFIEDDETIKAKEMIVNRQMPGGRYDLYVVSFFCFPGNDDAARYFDIATRFRENDFYRAASVYYTKTIELDRKHPVPYNMRGFSYLAAGSYDKAIEDFTQAIRLSPSYAEAYLCRGTAYKDKKDYDAAIADFTQAIKHDPERALAYTTRGTAYMDKGDYDKAWADFSKALELKPDNETALKALETLNQRDSQSET